MENESHKDDKVVEEVKIVHTRKLHLFKEARDLVLVKDDIQNVPKIRCNI
jgi:hypothetical protein